MAAAAGRLDGADSLIETLTSNTERLFTAHA